MFPLNFMALFLQLFLHGAVNYGTSCFYFCKCVYCGVLISGISVIYLATCTIVGTADGSTLPLIILCAFKSTLSYSLFTPKPKVPPSSIMFFFLKALIGKFAATFFPFSSVVYISLVLLTLVGGFCGFSF
jgi:hypothetical protein